MSSWTHVVGSILVTPPGRNEAEQEYLLKVITAKLPKITGSEGDVKVFYNKCGMRSSSYNGNEFLAKGFEDEDGGVLTYRYLISIQGDLRDRFYTDTFKELKAFLFELYRDMDIVQLCVSVGGSDGYSLIDKVSQIKRYGNKSYPDDAYRRYYSLLFEIDEETHMPVGWNVPWKEYYKLKG